MDEQYDFLGDACIFCLGGDATQLKNELEHIRFTHVKIFQDT